MVLSLGSRDRCLFKVLKEAGPEPGSSPVLQTLIHPVDLPNFMDTANCVIPSLGVFKGGDRLPQQVCASCMLSN